MNKILEKYSVISLFSGVGGLDLGFEQTGFKIIWANEIDKNTSITYKNNFDNILINKDIRKIKNNNIPRANILIAGFPCQPFSIAGYRRGFNDKRGNLFWEIIRIIKKSSPKIVMLENVKNLKNHNNGRTFKTIVNSLEKAGYNIIHKIISSKDFSVPQNRERIFIIGFKYKKHLKIFEWPKKEKNKVKINDVLEKNNKINEIYSYNNSKWFPLLNEKSKDRVLQIRRLYVRENKNDVFPTLTANMGMGGHNVPIIWDKKHKLFRKITVREAFNIQGFPKSFKLPQNVSNSNLYKQSGNAVTVTIANNIARKIKEVLDD